eukprot:TRINITY_DN8425_c0_g1_i2.p1 TRINITY_DN8425_c0_g1~~TRINITY_DN8425_c0_g1_i2.p1  ORF type:complete len:231 (+),score=23.47 TRINITY_DN8425_c0_g1_i2:2-694(+)
MIGGSSFTLGDKEVLLNLSGTVKVADFGLCKTLPKLKSSGIDATKNAAQSNDSKATDRFRLTGETGSYRYMAPEVFLHEPYNTKVDVYSFAMICFQLFEGKLPFEGTDPISAAKQAAMYKSRPSMPALAENAPNKAVREEIRKLMRACWDHDPYNRPMFTDIIKTLEGCLEQVGPRKNQLRLSQGGSSDGCCSVMQFGFLGSCSFSLFHQANRLFFTACHIIFVARSDLG